MNKYLEKTPKRNLVLWKYGEDQDKKILIYAIPEEERMRIQKEVEERGAENVDYTVTGEVISLNESASVIWDICDGTYTIEEMIKHYMEMFNIDENTATTDINNCLDFLANKQLIDMDWSSF